MTLRYLSANLLEMARRDANLQEPSIADAVVQAINWLDALVAVLADDPTAIEGNHACPACDVDPSRCKRPDSGPEPQRGECARASDPAYRPEPHDFYTFSLPRSYRHGFFDALERARELIGPHANKSIGALLSLICLDFAATNDFRREGPEQTARFLHQLEVGLQRRIIVVSDDGKEVEYGLPTLVKLAGHGVQKGKEGE